MSHYEIVIKPGHTGMNYWRDLWLYRELFYFLAWRDILVRYKQTAIGIAWALVRPFLTMLILTVVFNKVARLTAPAAISYPLVVFAAMLPWQFFSTALTEAGSSLISNANLISKVYFPRVIVPGGAVITSFIDFLVTLGLMAGLMAWYGVVPDWRVSTLPLFALLAFGLALGAGLFLCALNVAYRDFRYVVPFVVQFGLYLSPVGFSSDNVPEAWRVLYACNPMVGVIDGFRWALLGGAFAIWWPSIALSVLWTVALCVGGIWFFRRTERTFADLI